MSDHERILDLEQAVAKLISEVGRLWELQGERPRIIERPEALRESTATLPNRKNP